MTRLSLPTARVQSRVDTAAVSTLFSAFPVETADAARRPRRRAC
ncbi:hypothetical protein [Halobellus sp. H-GB7]|nr:hypothetical protein [Halobellus sp. H-GB7]MDQ2056131.1 hypothetical protein [Halobellus sp. H-GB7]